MQAATEICQSSDLVGEPLRLRPKFTFPPKQDTELNIWVKECLWLQLKIGVFEEFF